jgi:two-component system response regulator FixJ
MSALDKTTIHIVDDDDDLRESLVLLVQSAGYPAVSYTSSTDFLAAIEDVDGGCLIVEVGLPETYDTEAQSLLAAKGVRLPSVVMTEIGDAQAAVRAMKMGAVDFIEKPFSDRTLLSAIAAALEITRTAFLNQEIAHATRLIETLSPRQRQVLDALVAGHQNKMIAYTLGLSVRTVEAHRAHMMARLGVRQFAEAIRVAVLAQLSR